MKYLKKFNAHSDYLNLLPNDLPNVSYCKQEDELHYDLYTSPNKTNFINLYFTTVALESGVITFTAYSWADTTYFTSISYSKNGGEWTTFTNSDNRQTDEVINVSVVAGDEIRWKGIANHIGDDGDNGGVFASTCRFNAQGNIMSLLYKDDFKDKVTLEEGFSFSYLFNDINNGNTSRIVNASNLIVPATTLTVRCYDSMFSNCTTLIKSPSVLPATVLGDSCYSSMFSGCTSLVTAPELPATTLAEGCYSAMFYNCTSLTTAPELPATTLTPWCYMEMFQSCTNLNSITCLATNISATGCTEEWVEEVASTGTFIKAYGMNDWSTGINGIPNGWTIETASN